MDDSTAARQIWIAQLLAGKLVPLNDSPSVILLEDNTSVQRVRIYGIVVSTDELVIDDGTGSILVRSFDKTFNVPIGETILAIGKPRIYNNEHYLLGELVKRVEPKWVELARKQHPYAFPSSPASAPVQTEHPPTQSAITLVKMLDTGEGADYNLIIEKLGEKGEEIVIHLLAVGELFETRPGRLKVLE